MFNKKAIFINTASQIIGRIFTLGLTLVSIKILTNYLGLDGVGNFNTITTYINLFIVIADLGLFSVTVREISKDPTSEKKVLTTVFVIRLISAILACLLAIGIVFFTSYRNNPDLMYGIIIACGFLFFNLMASIYDMILQYKLKMHFSALAEFLGRLISLVALYLITIYHGSFLWTASTIALWGFLIFFFKWLFASRLAKFDKFVIDKKEMAVLLGKAAPLGVVFIISNLFFRLDTIMLFVIKGSAAVGIYTVAYKVLEVAAFFSSYFASSLKPTISQEIVKNKEGLAKIIQKSVTIMLFLGMPISIVCAVFAKEIILFLSSPEFVSGAQALVLLAFTLPVLYLDILLAEIMIANDERKLLLRISVFILIFNFVLNLILIPRYSFIGAAWGTLISEIVLLAVDIYFTKRIIRWTFDWPKIMKIFFVSGITMLIGYMIRPANINFLILIVITLLIYALLAYVIKIVRISTIKELIASK